MDLEDVARCLIGDGYSVIPIAEGEKRPSVKWTEFQSRYATEEEIDRWWVRDPDSNIAIVTGRISNLSVIDVDPRNGGENHVNGKALGRATVVTGGGGYHHYYRYLPQTAQTKPGLFKGIDFKSDGGYILCPPSRTSGEYRYTVADDFPPKRRDWPEEILNEVLHKGSGAGHSHDGHHYPGGAPLGSSAGSLGKLYLPTAAVGSRNNEAAKFIGKLFYKGIPEDRVVSIARLWNSGLKSPLDDSELLSVVTSIAGKHKKRTQNG